MVIQKKQKSIVSEEVHQMLCHGKLVIVEI